MFIDNNYEDIHILLGDNPLHALRAYPVIPLAAPHHPHHLQCPPRFPSILTIPLALPTNLGKNVSIVIETSYLEITYYIVVLLLYM